MANYDDLIQAVLNDPSDDAPRLVLADWFDEQGEPFRAEFIRTQIAMAECKTESYKYKALCDKERELWEAKGDDDWAILFSEAAPLFPFGRHDLLHQDSYNGLPFLQADLPSPFRYVRSRFITRTFPPILAWHRGFVYYYSDDFDKIRRKLPRLLAHHPITHAVSYDRLPVTETIENEGPFLWWQPRPELILHFTQLNLPNLLPDDLIDVRLNFPFNTPQEAILALSTVLVDEAIAKREKVRKHGPISTPPERRNRRRPKK